jgi:uncharacterized membrane protein YoaK (UPF0700 family)
VIAWVVVATVGNLILRVAWPAYAAVEAAMSFTLAMLLARLALGALSSLCAGFVAARITRRNGTSVKVLAVLLLAVFVPVHYALWDRFPVWYHVAFLLSLLVLPVLGAMCYSTRTERGRPHSSKINAAGPNGVARDQ